MVIYLNTYFLSSYWEAGWLLQLWAENTGKYIIGTPSFLVFGRCCPLSTFSRCSAVVSGLQMSTITMPAVLLSYLLSLYLPPSTKPERYADDGHSSDTRLKFWVCCIFYKLFWNSRTYSVLFTCNHSLPCFRFVTFV